MDYSEGFLLGTVITDLFKKNGRKKKWTMMGKNIIGKILPKNSSWIGFGGGELIYIYLFMRL